jgi:hypothetical protein
LKILFAPDTHHGVDNLFGVCGHWGSGQKGFDRGDFTSCLGSAFSLWAVFTGGQAIFAQKLKPVARNIEVWINRWSLG